MHNNKETIRVFTKDLVEKDKCHNCRARQLIKRKEAIIFTYENERCLKLNKYDSEILKDKEIA